MLRNRSSHHPWSTSLRRVLCALVGVSVAGVAGSGSRKAELNVRPSEKCVAIIEQAEGFRATLYRDTGGVPTIGFGHVPVAGENFLGRTLTRPEATDLLFSDMQHAEAAVDHYVTVLLKQEQYDALVCFVYNVGVTAFQKSTLLTKLNTGHCCAVPDQLRRWTRDNGRVIAGLLARRNAEIALYVGDA